MPVIESFCAQKAAQRTAGTSRAFPCMVHLQYIYTTHAKLTSAVHFKESSLETLTMNMSMTHDNLKVSGTFNDLIFTKVDIATQMLMKPQRIGISSSSQLSIAKRTDLLCGLLLTTHNGTCDMR